MNYAFFLSLLFSLTIFQGSSFAEGHFEQASRVDMPPPDFCFATPCSMPATQGQR